MTNSNKKIKVYESHIHVESIMTDDDANRYVLTKTWDVTKKTGLVIGINPSKATHLIGDNTATNAMNYFVDNGCGKMIIVNLFSTMCVEPKALHTKEKKVGDANINYIKGELKKADMIIVAWGYSDSYKIQRGKIRKLLLQYKDRTKCFQDNENNKPRHLRIFSDEWKLVNFF